MTAYLAIGLPGPGELLIIAFIVMVLFGAGKLPSVFRDLGKGIKEFKSNVGEVEDVKRELERR